MLPLLWWNKLEVLFNPLLVVCLLRSTIWRMFPDGAICSRRQVFSWLGPERVHLFSSMENWSRFANGVFGCMIDKDLFRVNENSKFLQLLNFCVCFQALFKRKFWRLMVRIIAACSLGAWTLGLRVRLFFSHCKRLTMFVLLL